MDSCPQTSRLAYGKGAHYVTTKRDVASWAPKFALSLLTNKHKNCISRYDELLYGTHKHRSAQGWLQRHPRFVPHFVPTSSSWLNLVERWFGELTGNRIRRGVFVSVADLIAAIGDYLVAWNANPQPFIWTATVVSIVEKLTRCKQTLERIQPAVHYRGLVGKK